MHQEKPVRWPSAERLQVLRRRMARIEGGRRPSDPRPVSSGYAALDRLLPGGGLHRGTLVEWLSACEGSGAETLALVAARQALYDGGALVVLDRRRQFYAPAAARLGIDLERLIVVRAAVAADGAWALDQALRCPAVAAVLAWPDALDDRAFRRLQLAAEQSGGLALLVRPHQARHEPSWADVRLWVEPRPLGGAVGRRRLRLEVLRCRGGSPGEHLPVEIDDEADPVPLGAAPLWAAGA